MKIINYEELTPEIARTGCLVLGMPNDAYHAYDGISKSGLDLIARSPAHFMYSAPREQTRNMVIGSAIHCAVFEPEVFKRDYVLLKDIQVRTASEYKQAIKVHNENLVLTGKEADYVTGMQSALYMNQHATSLLKQCGWAEIACFASDPVTGVLVKCKFDWLTESLIAVDLKKTQDAAGNSFSKSVANYRYHVQHAFYSDVFEWATGEQLQEFKFLAVEEQLPHFSKLYNIDTPSIEYGRKLYREALNTYAECLQRNEWPLPDGATEYITLPSWAADPEQYEGEF